MQVDTSIAKDAPAKTLERGVRLYVERLRGAPAPLPAGTVDALRETMAMLTNFGRASLFTRRRLVLEEFTTRLEAALLTQLDEETVGAILRHTRKQLDEEAMPVIL
jgi:hypothetical protein